ncbi:ABC transporter ATP-binding protein [Hoeflea sp.]|uniref:ABC transporter ATP-binding protein n=1 Tax=Hoeflea sp. TaxID=1940281 RepID=UPI00374A688D
MTMLIQARDVAVHGPQGRLVEPVSLTLKPGVPLSIVGETGSGKSLLMQALMGTLPAGLQASGTARIADEDFDLSNPAGMRRLWGRTIAVLPQEPWLALDPTMRSRAQVAEVHHLVRQDGDGGVCADADLATVGLKKAAHRLPGQLSGGMAQRLAFSAARAGGGTIQFADEPTKGLDTTMRDEIADLLLGRVGSQGGLLTVTHDLDLAHRLGGEAMVMLQGRIVEEQSVVKLLSAPAHEYTKRLVAAQPSNWAQRQGSESGEAAVISGRGLAVVRGGVRLFEGVDFDLAPGTITGILGPSGCGKTSLGNALLGLVPLAGGGISRDRSIATHRFQKLWQDPPSAFARKMTIGRELEALAKLHGVERQRMDRLRQRLRLSSDLLDRLPGHVSGGELQRIALMRALMVNPVFLFADEPTSRLDLITQQEVIDMLGEVVREESLALLIVSHDGDLLARFCDHVVKLDDRTAMARHGN